MAKPETSKLLDGPKLYVEESKLKPFEFMDSPELHDTALADSILAAMPDADAYWRRQRRRHPPENVAIEMAPSYRQPLLNPAQEHHLFRQLNYLKYQYNQMLEVVKVRRKDLVENELRCQQLDKQITELEELLFNANTRLIFSMVKNHHLSLQESRESFSEHSLTLLRSIRKFDYTRTYYNKRLEKETFIKFSTYATWAITKTGHGLWHKRRADRLVTNIGISEIQVDQDFDATMTLDEQRLLLGKLLVLLEPRERLIVRLRSGLDGPYPITKDDWTLGQIGEQLGLTKERVRQLYNKAIDKLRAIAMNPLTLRTVDVPTESPAADPTPSTSDSGQPAPHQRSQLQR